MTTVPDHATPRAAQLWLLSPILASAARSLSSVVLTNSLRLRRFGRTLERSDV